MAKLVVCRSCGKRFDPDIKKKVRGGYVDQCAPCATDDRKGMYLGRLGGPNKGASVEIFRENLAFVRQVLNAEKNRGPTANLIISNVANEQIRQAKKEEEGE